MTLQATLQLDRAFLNLVADPSVYVSCGTSGAIGGGGQRQDIFARGGSFRTYANNVTRLILGATSNRVNTFALRALTPAQLAILNQMVGQTVLFRDTYGRRIYGSFLITTATDIPHSGKAHDDLKTDVGITFVELTYDEAV